MMDVVVSGARPVVVPFTGNGETEQRARGVRLDEFDLAVVVDDRTNTPDVLAAAVDAAGTRERWGRWNFDSDGAAQERRDRDRSHRGVRARSTDCRLASSRRGARPLAAMPGPTSGPLVARRRRMPRYAALQRLLAVAQAANVPVALAVIPAHARAKPRRRRGGGRHGHRGPARVRASQPCASRRAQLGAGCRTGRSTSSRASSTPGARGSSKDSAGGSRRCSCRRGTASTGR